MKVTIPSPIQKLDRITPTIYEAALKCHARASWTARGDNSDVPRHPRALLGLAAHAVFEGARRGAIEGGDVEERRKAAGRLFDTTMEGLFQKAHPLLVAKFGSHVRLPYFHLQRERTALMAAELADARRPSTDAGVAGAPPMGRLVESMLQSRDGAIAGRPDVFDREGGTVMDYKTGSRPPEGGLTDGENRQLKLYAFLGMENGVQVRKGVVVRSDRSRAELDIADADVAAEASRARDTLEAHNRLDGRAFADAATPSPDACRFCPCIPFCDAFWREADETWASECGWHMEGEVTAVQGDALLSVEMVVHRGTAPRGAAVLARLSERWLTFDGTHLPAPGDLLRVTDVLHVEESAEPAILRADRTSTAVWTIDRGER
jgi:PD-(D/E)XK nuclease superfamily